MHIIPHLLFALFLAFGGTSAVVSAADGGPNAQTESESSRGYDWDNAGGYDWDN